MIFTVRLLLPTPTPMTRPPTINMPGIGSHVLVSIGNLTMSMCAPEGAVGGTPTMGTPRNVKVLLGDQLMELLEQVASHAQRLINQQAFTCHAYDRRPVNFGVRGQI